VSRVFVYDGAKSLPVRPAFSEIRAPPPFNEKADSQREKFPPLTGQQPVE